MNIIDHGPFKLTGLDRLNVLLGKNGCGKSHLLKTIEQGFFASGQYGVVRYITPERGGFVTYEANIEQNILNNPNWMSDTRRQNQTSNFRQQSATLFLRLERMVLRQIEREHLTEGYKPKTFDNTIAQLNGLLDRVALKREDEKGFEIVEKDTGKKVDAATISSGEAELISLGIEFLAFAQQCDSAKHNLLLVDEPDVHLHPDLQDRLARFIQKCLPATGATLILATHSTALLAALGEDTSSRVAFMKRGATELSFKPISEIDKAVLPVFGAHPLSNVFNQSKLLLLEGEDDERIWQQATRSSGGSVRVYPCDVGGISELGGYESEVDQIVQSVYDNGVAYSLRDRDDGTDDISNLGCVFRMRLSCRAAENLMLSDDVLSRAEITWQQLQVDIDKWIQGNPTHQYHGAMKSFYDGGCDRKGADLKKIRLLLAALLSNKPWEVLVGQTIAAVAQTGGADGEHSMRAYLSEKVCQHLLPATPQAESGS